MDIVAFGQFRMDRKRRILLAGTRAVPLQGRAFDILDYMVDCRDRVLTRDDIVAHVWHGMAVSESNVTVQISSLRRMLTEFGGEGLIITLAGRGYRFVGEVDAAAGAAECVSEVPVATVPQPPAWQLLGRRGLWVGAAALGLVASMVVGVSWQAPPRAASGPVEAAFAPPPHSVAILAFTNMTGDAAQDYVSDGLADELIDTLSRSPQLQVVARTSSFYFKGKPATIFDIGRRLNVGAVLEGSVRRQGAHYRVNAQLTDARTGYTLWARSFDREAGDLLKTEADIAAAVGDALQASLLSADGAATVPQATKIPGAFDAYLRGVQAMRAHMEAPYRDALADFDIALKLDPNFALAYSARANALTLQAAGSGHIGSDDMRRMFAEALASADKGIALAPEEGATHAARGMVLHMGYLDNQGAMKELTEARRLTPGSATIEQIYAGIAISVGAFGDGLAAARHATELDPLRQDAWETMAFVLYNTRDFAGALDAFSHARAIAGMIGSPFGVAFGASEVFVGHPDAAVRECVGRSDWQSVECLAIAYHAIGKQSEAAGALAKLQDLLGDNGSYNYAQVYAQWGNTAQALQWLQAAMVFKDSGLSEMNSDPLLDPVRKTQEFAAFTRRVSVLQ